MLEFIDLQKEIEDQLRVSAEERVRTRRWANWGQRLVARVNSWTFLELHTRAKSSLDNPNIYTLPRNFMKPSFVRVENSSGEFINIDVVHLPNERARSPKHTDQALTPNRAVFTGRTLIMRPGFNVDTSFIHLDYLQTPPEMKNDADVPILPEIFRDAIVTAGVWIGSKWLFQDKGDQDRAKANFKEAVFDLLKSEEGTGPQEEVLNGMDDGWEDMLVETGNAGNF